MLKQHKTILILAPHTDDGEFGCGASINKWISEGKEVYYATFSACKQSVLPQFPEDILITEVKEATSTLGIKPENLILFDYEVRTFNYHRQAILDDLIKLREKINPDLVLMPSLNDIHQDHKTIAEEGLRAFKFKSILCYEMPWNNLNFNTASFSILEKKHVDCKLLALEKYQSQAHRPYSKPEFIRGLAISRGVQISSEYAEVFEVLRWII
ncbi:MAG: PIG-L family deacetylase [Bacteroidia bacterium]|nr:PIG-L family deacetylase [Bacteroidia bacterium]NNJ55862.1 PIG-L family deacetylase [Bacteroidia bacterium]